MFLKKAKVGLNEGWRYLVGTVMIFFGWNTVAMLPVFALFGYVILQGGNIRADYVQAAADVGVGKNMVLSVMLFSFLLACVVVYLVVRYFHKKPFLSIITSRKSFSWARAGYGFFVWVLITFAVFLLGYQQSPDDYVFSFDVVKFIPLVIICILLLPFQTSFEELFMRGYLMQGVGLLTGSRILALLLPALVFGLLHSFNPEVFEYGFFMMMPFYVGMGLFLGIMAIMDEGIEMPMGVHFANNFMAAVFVSMENSALQTDALFMAKNYDPIEAIPYSLAMMVLFLLAAAFTFKWKNWGKLIGKI